MLNIEMSKGSRLRYTIPPPKCLFRVYRSMPLALFSLQSGHVQSEVQGGVITTSLCALVGGSFLLIVIGLVISTPLVWALTLSIGQACPEKNNQGSLYRPKAELVQKKILPRTTYEQIGDKIEAKQK